jgi:thiol-disulfide isomerase/thioredoxin
MAAVQVKSAFAEKIEDLLALEENLKGDNHAAAARFVHLCILSVKIDKARDTAELRGGIEELKRCVGDGPLQPIDGKIVVQAAYTAEWHSQEALAADLYERAAKRYADQPAMVVEVKRLKACVRRLRLVGKKMRLEGKTLDGKDLDWAKFRGKVVLIDFWATWCGPCREEIVNIKKSYERLHDRGFEVIGISRDTMPAAEIAAFAKKENVPWVLCRDADAPESMADYYGITGIPTLILVGRDGKVVSLNPRGEALGPALDKAFAAGEKKRKADKAAAIKLKREQAMKARAATFRTWTAANGVSHTKAKFRGAIGDVVKLELESGKVIEVPLDKLSDDDQKYIEKRKRM